MIIRPFMTPAAFVAGITMMPDTMTQQTIAASSYGMAAVATAPQPTFQIPAVLRTGNEQRREAMSNRDHPAAPPPGGRNGTPPAPSSPGGRDDGSGPVRRATPAALKAQRAFMDFIGSYDAEVGEISEKGLSIAHILPERSDLVKLTRFTALDDTLVFSKLVSRLVGSLSPSVSTLIDLGAGSSIPTIRALLDNEERSDLQVLAVDNDAEAIRISGQNAEVYDLRNRYVLIQGEVVKFMLAIEVGQDQAISANLPYLPFPSGLTDGQYRTVNGGPDGTLYIEQLLKRELPSGTMVALEWSSLSNPVRIIKTINERYDVLHVVAYRAPFGTYTGSERMSRYLHSLRDQGISVFTTDADGNDHYHFVGTILRRR